MMYNNNTNNGQLVDQTYQLLLLTPKAGIIIIVNKYIIILF